jgi:hypothetical protein
VVSSPLVSMTLKKNLQPQKISISDSLQLKPISKLGVNLFNQCELKPNSVKIKYEIVFWSNIFLMYDWCC